MYIIYHECSYKKLLVYTCTVIVVENIVVIGESLESKANNIESEY